MSPAVASLLALLVAIALSLVSRINVGLLAIALAWGVGAFAYFPPDRIVAGFPTSLFVTLAGVTLLFSLAETNGTIAQLAIRLTQLTGRRARLLPATFFLIAVVVSSAGPGAIPAVALIAPFAFATGAPAGIPLFLTALMVANGANAGNLSPISVVGIIANDRMESVGLGGHDLKVFAANFFAHLFVSAIAYGILVRRIPPRETHITTTAPVFTRQQWLTIAVVGSWMLAVVLFSASLGLSAFAAAVLLVVLRGAEEAPALKAMPWSAILMVSGVAMLVTTAERAGGLDLFTALLSKLATPATLNGVIAFVTGAISSCSSTSGVVLPTFLPTAPGLVQQVGGGDPLAVALSINVGSALVDVSPLSTIGALCVAAINDAPAARELFRKMLIWGLSMMFVGALLCQLFAGWYAGM
jgi:di/tricarboxylate transporter